jgi:hypothetical protein
VPLTPKTAEVLAVLVERHGTIVEKEDLLRFVWPNAVGWKNNLPQHIFDPAQGADGIGGNNLDGRGRGWLTLPGGSLPAPLARLAEFGRHLAAHVYRRVCFVAADCLPHA